jgi:hypothetical protein
MQMVIKIIYPTVSVDCKLNLDRWDPSNKLDIPFNVTLAYAISTMLGSDDLRATVKKFLIDNSDHPDSQVGIVCKYLSVILS